MAASFCALALLRPAALDRYFQARLPLFVMADRGRTATSLCSLAVVLMLVASGFLGSHDPLANPLPLVVWTVLWVGFTLLQGAVGHVWYWLDPWYGIHRFATHMLGIRKFRAFPRWLGLWPAVLLFLGFAWFELIDLAPEDPPRLAAAVSAYLVATLAAMMVFGHEPWGRRAEFLSVFFTMVARFSVLDWDRSGDRSVSLCWPGAKLAAAEPMPASGVVFLLAVLASVSFDGLSKTFLWLGANGINPLEFPGRSAVMTINSAGLLAAIAVLAALFFLAVWLGLLIVDIGSLLGSAGLLIYSIVPIALAYHSSHYITALLVDGQYALVALSDPFGRGWNVFGTAHRHVEAGIVMGHDSAWAIWNAQAVAIVSGHVLAVVLAHRLSLRLHADESKAVISQVPLAVLMVGYTLFGLWLLSTPSAG